MTTSFAQTNTQDSSSYRGSVIQDTLKTANAQIVNDTASIEIPIHEESIVSVVAIGATVKKSEPIKKEIDTISVCRRSPVVDIIFASPEYVADKLYINSANRFPFQFAQKNNELQAAEKERIEKSLKGGEALPSASFNNDWTIGVIIFAVILFSTVYASVNTFFSGIARFFLFRGIKEEAKKATELFQWKSAFLNISSFFIISIFAYIAVSYSNVIHLSLSGFKIWLFSAAIITVALALRYLICSVTGLMSGATEIFDDYIITVYQSYRFSGLFLFFAVVLFFYTTLISAKICLITGCSVMALLYLIRILRLFLLFINYKVSILYLILYLCALEILPVLVSIKYFSGLM